jgi:hypothetical protein
MEQKIKYLVHVIDSASIFENLDNQWKLIESKDQDNNVCEILLSDAFYSIEASDIMDVLTNLSNIIKVKTTDQEITLAESLLNTKNKLKIFDFESKNEPTSLLSSSDIKKVVNPYSKYFCASCQIKIDDNTSSYYELHEISFYIVEENKIMDIS